MAADSYEVVASLHARAALFAPMMPVGALPYLAFALLAATFFFAFYFTTLPKNLFNVQEIIVATLASLAAGFGTVALFNSVGVYV